MRAIQFALTKVGYDLKGTGNYGPKTQSVVADFQARHGLEVDGEIGSETAKAIDAVLATANKPAADVADATPPLAHPAPPVARAPLTSLECPVQSGLAALLGDRSLRVGDEGDYVRASQLALAKLGYDLKGTGTFGGQPIRPSLISSKVAASRSTVRSGRRRPRLSTRRLRAPAA